MSLYKPLMSHAGLMLAHYTAAALGEIHILQPIPCAFMYTCVYVYMYLSILILRSLIYKVLFLSPVSEDKVLTHPSSVDSIPTSAGQEDHVSMGGFAARKALTVVEHAETGIRNKLLFSFFLECSTSLYCAAMSSLVPML